VDAEARIAELRELRTGTIRVGPVVAMREHPTEVTLDLSGGRWSLVVAALQRSRGEYEHRVTEAAAQGNTFGVAVWTETVRELSELLAAVDAEGERQEVEFTEQMMQQRRNAGENTL